MSGIPYHNIVGSLQISQMVNQPIQAIVQSTSKWRRAYLGKGKFDIQEVMEIQYEVKANDWFKKEVSLFIEYLNKIKDINYSEMGKKIKLSSKVVGCHELSLKNSARLLIKYRNYVKEFEEYYYG